MTNVKLNKNRDLLDPNFSGYKLSLDSVAVTTTDIPPEAATSHLNPSNDQYRSVQALYIIQNTDIIVQQFSARQAVR